MHRSVGLELLVSVVRQAVTLIHTNRHKIGDTQLNTHQPSVRSPFESSRVSMDLQFSFLHCASLGPSAAASPIEVTINN